MILCKEKLCRSFTANITVHLDNGLFKNVIGNYNNSYHCSIGMTPREAKKKKSEKKFRDVLYKDLVALR